MAEHEVVMSRFRCADPNCNTLLTRYDHDLGRCGGCQGVRFVIAKYITEEEAAQIEAGILKPHEVNLDQPGIEPPAPRGVS